MALDKSVLRVAYFPEDVHDNTEAEAGDSSGARVPAGEEQVFRRTGQQDMREGPPLVREEGGRLLQVPRTERIPHLGQGGSFRH